MNPDYINLVLTEDAGSPFMNMNVIMASSIQPMHTPHPPIAHIEAVTEQEHGETLLSEYESIVDETDSLIQIMASNIVLAIRQLDPEYSDKYVLNINRYCDCELNITIYAKYGPTVEAIQRISLALYQGESPDYGSYAKIYVNGLYVNKKYQDVGSNILSILKLYLMQWVDSGQLSVGMIELGSVDTAVMFYIKNGFVISDLFNKSSPQQKAYATQRMLEFAIKENNPGIMKMYAKLSKENFADFIKFLMEKTKYGRFFKAYIDALPEENGIEQSVMQSKFISSLFNTNMIFQYVRAISKPKIMLKQLTV